MRKVYSAALLSRRRTKKIAAPIDIVFETILEQMRPLNYTPDGSPLPMKLEPWPGGRCFEIWVLRELSFLQQSHGEASRIGEDDSHMKVLLTVSLGSKGKLSGTADKPNFTFSRSRAK